MRTVITFIFCLILTITTLAEDLETFKKISGLSLPAKDLAELRVSTEHRGATYTFSIVEYKPKTSAKDLRKLKKKGKVPFRICITVIEAKKGKSKKTLRGKAEIYVVNTEDYKIVTKKKLGLNKLCPS